MTAREVVITGMGAVSPYGVGLQKLVDNCWLGRSAVSVIDEWKSIKGLGSYLAAPVPSLDPKKYLPRSARRTMGDMAVYATIATQEAIQQARITQDQLQSGNIGIVIGTTTGSPFEYSNFYEEFLSTNSVESLKSGMFFKIMGHTCAANVMYALGIKGEQWAPTSACTSSSQSRL